MLASQREGIPEAQRAAEPARTGEASRATEAPAEPKLDHLARMTDGTGMIQHAVYSLPDRATGYTTDDNARALVAALKVYETAGSGLALRLAETYLGFLIHAQLPCGRFHNLMGYDRRFLDRVGSEDSIGRAVWGTGYACSSRAGVRLGLAAARVLERALPWLTELEAPRARAFAALGLYHYLSACTADRTALATLHALADSLVESLRCSSVGQWRWFEDTLTYSNAIMPTALLRAYARAGDRGHLEAGLGALEFLTRHLWRDGYLKLVGHAGWYPRGGSPAEFDEQPVDAADMVQAYAAAYSVTGDPAHHDLALAAMDWFFGRNALGLPLYDPGTGGCYDGLTPTGVNLNQGAESLVSFLLAHFAAEECREQRRRAVA